MTTPVDDLAAFRTLYDRTVTRVFGLVQGIVSDPAQAEKVTFDVYLDLWRTADDVNPADHDPESRVLALAHRHAVDHRRSRQAPAATKEMSAPSGLDAFDPETGKLLLLTYYRGYTCRQAATLLGLPVAAAHDRLRTALRTLARAGGPQRRRPNRDSMA